MCLIFQTLPSSVVNWNDGEVAFFAEKKFFFRSEKGKLTKLFPIYKRSQQYTFHHNPQGIAIYPLKRQVQPVEVVMDFRIQSGEIFTYRKNLRIEDLGIHVQLAQDIHFVKSNIWRFSGNLRQIYEAGKESYIDGLIWIPGFVTGWDIQLADDSEAITTCFQIFSPERLFSTDLWKNMEDSSTKKTVEKFYPQFFENLREIK